MQNENVDKERKKTSTKELNMMYDMTQSQPKGIRWSTVNAGTKDCVTDELFNHNNYIVLCLVIELAREINSKALRTYSIKKLFDTHTRRAH